MTYDSTPPERMDAAIADEDTLHALAERARAAWLDPEVLSPREAWVNVADDDSITAWGFAHGILP
jgi:hypothetical protein